MSSIYMNWGSAIVKLTWRKDFHPTRELITSVHGFCFLEDNLLMVHLNDRGWDLPGGHIEKGEAPEECLKREVLEEGYVKGDSIFLGALEVNHQDNPNWNEASPYPLVGYQLFYKMNINKVLSFKGENESDERMFIHPSEISKYKEWYGMHQEMLLYAMQIEVRR
ncbi:NUDIX hydrolase [Ornithinibacillus scapharcae]|uniref:NUDIX hydrolase n=1 Tax=Ornithinibacillus scapharcae TaxID=1147159 RepID=UPI000225ADCF|nr:NUDIX domain-containing protein [Ornithinibacillus scapharcae]